MYRNKKSIQQLHAEEEENILYIRNILLPFVIQNREN